MKIDSPEFDALADKYSLLKDLKAYIELGTPSFAELPNTGLNDVNPTALTELEIDFKFSLKPADGKCMFLQADNIGWGDGSFIHWIPKTGEPLIGRRLEKAYALNREGASLSELMWPKNRDERIFAKEFGERTKLFSKDVMWAKRLRGNYSDPIWDETQFLGWFSCTVWYSTKKDSEGNPCFGEPARCDVSLDLYESPPTRKTDFGTEESGFDNLHYEANFFEHLDITNKIMTEGQLDHDHDLVTIGGMLYELAHQFYEDVFTQGMKKILDGKQRGGSGQVGNVKVLGAEMCGYHRVTLEAKIAGERTWISLQVRPDSKNMLVIGSGGVLPNLRKLVRSTIAKWPKYKDRFREDGKVSVM